MVGYATRGPAVLELQTMLEERGHIPGPIDGVFGPMTRSAVAGFQNASGLDESGTVDQATWDGLAAVRSG